MPHRFVAPRSQYPRPEGRISEVLVEGTPTRILLADDDTEMRRMLALALREEGYDVVEAKDGPDLLHKLKFDFLEFNAVATVDIIITDHRMPGVTGLEVLEGLRHVDWATSVVLISAFADDEVRADAKRFGAAAVLAKPFPVALFLDTVRSIAPPH